MSNIQVVVEVVDVEFYCSDREEGLQRLMFSWANERALPLIEHIKCMQAKAWMNFIPIVSCHPKE